MAKPVLIFDFDGTVCTGDEATLDFAFRVGGEKYVRAIELYLQQGPVPGTVIDTADDAWRAVGQLAAADGISDQLDEHFLATRTALREGTVPAHPPEGFTAWLDGLKTLGATVILATNSPAVGMPEMLRAIGVDGHFSELITDADKPRGMAQILDALLLEHSADDLMSVGDLWNNDLAPAAERGVATAYIDRWNIRQGEATFHQTSLPLMYKDIENWVKNRI